MCVCVCVWIKGAVKNLNDTLKVKTAAVTPNMLLFWQKVTDEVDAYEPSRLKPNPLCKKLHPQHPRLSAVPVYWKGTGWLKPGASSGAHHRLFAAVWINNIMTLPRKLCGHWWRDDIYCFLLCLRGCVQPCCRPSGVLSEWNLTASVRVMRCGHVLRWLRRYPPSRFPFSAADYMCAGLSGSASRCGARWNHSTQQSYSSS